MKIPKQIYVTAKKQPIYGDYDPHKGTSSIIGFGPPLGFLHPWNPKKPDDKKHVTQREWAYNNGLVGFKLVERSGHAWITGQRRRYINGKMELIDVDEFADPQPMVYDNDPLAGFKVQHSVSRYSTSNKLWRILDPRGFEVEVTTACMEELIEATTIIKGGLIEAKCVWVSNKNLVVAP